MNLMRDEIMLTTRGQPLEELRAQSCWKQWHLSVNILFVRLKKSAGWLGPFELVQSQTHLWSHPHLLTAPVHTHLHQPSRLALDIAEGRQPLFTSVLKLNICFTPFSHWKIIVCLSTAIKFVSFDFSGQLKFFLSGINRTDGFIAMHRKRNVSILFLLSEYRIFVRLTGQFWRRFFLWTASSRRHSPDVKVEAVCQSLTNLVRGTTYGLRVSASFLRSAPGRRWAVPRRLGRHSGAGWRLEAGLDNGLGPEDCAMETVGCMNCWCST